MVAMLTLDRVIEELRRTGGNRLVLASDSEPRLTTPQGEVTLDLRVIHREIITMVEGIVPAARFADLVMMEPVSFDLRVPAGDLTVRVVPGPSIWRVTFTVLGEHLEPLPIGVEGGESPRPAVTENPVENRSVSSGPLRGGPGSSQSADGKAALPAPQREGERARTLAPGSTAPPVTGQALSSSSQVPSASELEDVLDLEGFVVGSVLETPPAEAAPATASLGTRGAQGSDPGWSHVSLDGALVRSRKTSEVEVRVSSEAEERSRRGDSFATGSTIQLSAEDLAAVASRTVSAALGDADAEEARPSPPSILSEPEEQGSARAPEVPGAPMNHRDVGLVGDVGGAGEPEEAGELGEPGEPGAGPSVRERNTTGSYAPVQPIEIDLHEEESPRIQIDALDRLLERAFGAGATSVLLRDRRPPAMGVADRVEPLPGGRPEDGSLVQKLLDVAASPSHVGQLDIEGFCRFVYRPGGGGGLVRCTLVRDGGAVAAWLRHIGDEHLPVSASRWLPASVRNAMPESGLVLVAGPSGHGKTTTAAALTVLSQQSSSQTLVVADPLERRLPADSAGILQRQIPEDVPSAGRALGDALRLEAHLVLVDIPRPEAHALEILSLASQGRLVLATWIAPDGAAAVESLLDALPPSMSPVERARRARALRTVVAVRLVPGRERGVQPIFEILPVSDLFLEAVSHGRMGHETGGRDLLALTFEASMASLRSRGLI